MENKKQILEEAAERIITDMGWVWENTESSARRVAEYCAKWQQERMISKEAYEDSLNMQRASNAGYESKIAELKAEIKKLNRLCGNK